METNYKNTFGLDISNTALTAVELSYGKSGLRVVNYSRVNLEAGVVEDNCIIINPQAFKDAVAKLLLEAKSGPITSRNVIISICEEKTFSHHLNIPKEHAKDDEFIRNAAKDYIPIALNETTFDYKQIKNGPDEKEVTLNFVAIQKTIISSLIKILGEADLNVAAIDVSKNSIIRACENRFHKNEGDFMVVNISMEKSVLNICTSSGLSHNIDANVGGCQFNQKIKETLNMPSNEDVRNLLIEFNKDQNAIKAEQQQLIKDKLQGCYKTITQKAIELAKAVGSQESFNLNTIYITGCHSCIPGLNEIFQASFPNAEIKQKLDYIELDETTELFYTQAIGLALRTVLPEADKNDVNLLPKEKKDELYVAKITPTIRRYLLGLGFLFGALLIFSGTLITKSFTDYKVSSQEAILLTEKTLNPYLTEAARARQHKTQLESQMTAILRDSVPGSQIMKTMDRYNDVSGVSMINTNYKITNNKEIDMRLRAKTISRDKTESFIVELEKNPYYLEVASPLSNLVGQGERFVNMDLKLDPTAVIDDFYGKTEVATTPPSDEESLKAVSEEEPVETSQDTSPEGDETEEPVEDTESIESAEGDEQVESETKKPTIQTKTDTNSEEQ